MTKKSPPDQPAPGPAPFTSRGAVRVLFEQVSDKLDVIDLPALTDVVVAMVKDDPSLLNRFLDEHLRPMCYEIGMSMITSQRVHEQRLSMTERLVLDALAPPQDLRTRLGARRSSSAGFQWLREPIWTASGRHLRLAVAKRADLGSAIDLGSKAMKSVQVKLRYYALVREGLTSEEQTVGERYTEAQLEAAYARAQTEDEQEGPQPIAVIAN